MKNLTILLAILMSYTAHSQSFSVFNVETANFPAVKANFYAFDAAGNQITNLSPSDFELTEDGVQRNITLVSCPSPKPSQPVSSVLTIDISGSMKGSNMDMAKTAAKVWIDAMNLAKSECAVTSFNKNNYLNQDFTTDRQKLISAVDNLNPGGGTSFDAGLISPKAGALLIADKGKHKKVVVFLTDGKSKCNAAAVIQKANQINAVVYCIALNLPCPQSLKDISAQTGGQWFENISSSKEAEDAYRQILMRARGSDPCTIEWQSGVSCYAGITNVEITLLQNGAKAATSYQSPNTSVAKLEFDPSYVKFADPEVGVTAEQKVTVTARNADFTITNITANNASFFITPDNFTLNDGQSLELTVSYIAPDSGYVYCRFDIENDVCPTKFYASGGWRGKRPTIKTIKLIHPNGGEVFVAGSDTVITWEGVPPEEPVKLEYRTDDNQPWVTIADSATGLNHPFRVPKVASKKYLARVTAAAKSGYFDNEMVLIPAGTFQMGNTGAYSGYSNEKPVHSVTISRDFLMSKYEITQKQYEEVMGTNPSYFKGENLPVEMVSWYDAVEFCNKLSDMEGLERCYSGSGADIVCDWDANGYRLPTEAEWEYACKAGTTTDFYSGSLTNENCDPIDANLDKIGWYCGNSESKTHEVGQKEPNVFGLYDMSGNVWEWCWDWYGNYTNTAVTDPKGNSSGSFRVLRGGSWIDYAFYCRSAYRSSKIPDLSNHNYGFRVSRTY